VDAILGEKFGETAKDFLKTKSQEIGMTIDELKDMAGRNPKAFFQLTGVTVGGVPSRNQSALVGGGTSAEAGMRGRNESRDFGYYQNLRKTNPKEYYSPSVQTQYAKDRELASKDQFYRGYEQYNN